MRFNRLRAHNMGVFKDFSLDLSATPGPLVALVGPNGSGKSTALELLFGGIYRDCPTRGSLADLATARDSYVEVQVSTDKDYTFRQSVDAVSRKGETLITNGTGAPVLATTKVRDADAWVAQHMPPRETLLASLFAHQQSAGFLGMLPGERKGVLLKILGVEKLERLSEQARERARDAKAAASTLAARVDDEHARGGDVAALELELDRARSAAEQADAAAAQARQGLADAQAQAATVGAAMAAYDAAVRARADLRRRRDAAAEQLRELEERVSALSASAGAEPALAKELEDTRSLLSRAEQTVRECEAHLSVRREELAEARRQAAAATELEAQRGALSVKLDAARTKLADLEVRIRNNEAVLADREDIETAVAEVARLEAEERQVRQDASQADADAKLAAQRGEEALRAVATHQDRARQERARAERLRDALAQAEAIESAARCLPGLQRDVEAAEAQITAAAAELEALQGRRVAGAEERIGGLRGGLGRIATDRERFAGDHAREAAATLDSDDAAVRAASELPTLLAQAAARGCAARERAARARSALQEAAELAALAGRLKADRVALEQADAAAVAADDAADAAERERAAAVHQAAANRGARDGYLERAQALAAEVERLRPTAAKAAPLANAEALLAERRPAAEVARAEATEIGRELDELATRIAASPRPDVERAEMDVGWAEAALNKSRAEQLVAAGAPLVVERLIAAARGAAARLAELDPQVDRERAALTAIDQELAAGADPSPPPPPLEVAVVERAAADAESASRAAHQAVAVAEQRLEQARAVAGRLAELGEQLAATELDLADWTRLAADLGRDGLQAAEIDAAGPELTELVNDLLHHAHGTRWTVSIETQQLSADGKKMLEGCAVRVLDTERGRDAAAESLSGGERVIVGEAVSLALAMLACRRAGVERPTLVRDESGAALDAMAARAYVAMLRRAAEIVGADRVVLVSHTPEVWEMCDARVDVGAAP